MVLNEAAYSWDFSRSIFQRLMIFLNRRLILRGLKIRRVSVNLIFAIIILTCISIVNFSYKSLADSLQVLLNCLKMIGIKSILLVVCFCLFYWLKNLSIKANNLFLIVWLLVVALLLLILFLSVLRIPFFLIAFLYF